MCPGCTEDGGGYGSGGRYDGDSRGSGGGDRFRGDSSDLVMQEDTIFVSCMPPQATEEDVKDHFGSIGVIKVKYAVLLSKYSPNFAKVVYFDIFTCKVIKSLKRYRDIQFSFSCTKQDPLWRTRVQNYQCFDELAERTLNFLFNNKIDIAADIFL